MSETVNLTVLDAKNDTEKKNTAANTESVTVRRDMVQRLIKDIKDVHADAGLVAQGIYYEHNMDNFMEGHAMLVGPADTPYENGLFFFRLKFPEEYPYSPPVIRFLSHSVNNRVRINPNLYIEGKVCLSVLNTWEGEPWSACQSIRSILLILLTVLNEKPLMNEPGIQDTSLDHGPYNKIIRYTSLNDCFLLPMSRCTLENKPFAHEELCLGSMQKHFAFKFNAVESELRSMDFMQKKDRPEEGASNIQHFTVKTRAYGLCVRFDRQGICELLAKLKTVSK